MRHAFYRYVLVFFATRWKCGSCGMIVPDYRVAQSLEGKPCR